MLNSVRGAGYLLQGLRLINQPGVRPYALIPLAINVVLFGALIWYGASQFGAFIEWLLSPLPDWLDWLAYLLWPVFALAAALLVFFTFSLVANLLGAPFNGLLAEAVERHLSGQAPLGGGEGWKRALLDLGPALLDEVRKLLYFVVWAVPLLILFVIPVINAVAPLLWLVFGAWMLALEYSDFPLGNRGLAFAEQRRHLRGRRGLAMGFGAATMLATMAPFFNFLVMPVAVAGATAMWSEQNTKSTVAAQTPTR